MTDPALVAKKLALIETCLSELARLARPESLESDVRERRFPADEHSFTGEAQPLRDVEPGSSGTYGPT